MGISADDLIGKALEQLPKMNIVDARMTMYDLYESKFEIYNHLAEYKSRPLATVAMHDAEDINSGSQLEEALTNFVTKGVKDAFGISVLEFLELPKDIIEMMFGILSKWNAEKSAELDAAQKQFNDLKTKK